jgi:16S rRNA (cytosine967-C5)-methyltransferase
VIGLGDTAVRVLSSSRLVAHQLLSRVQSDDAYINLLLPSFINRSGLPEQDRGLVQEMAYGALRWQLQYDAIIDLLAGGKELEDAVRIALRLGLHQLFRMRVPSHAAINETVELVKKLSPRAAGFANAILRNADRQGLEPLVRQATQGMSNLKAQSIKFSHPEWVVGALLDALALDGRSDLESVLNANNETPNVNLAALSVQAKDQLISAGLSKSSVSPIGFTVEGNPEPFLGRDVRVQDDGSQLVALTLLELASENGTFLDMCSGPGGKSAVLLSGLRQGKLDCFEPAAHRAQLVRQAVGHDERAVVIEKIGQEAAKDTYDAVLLDAPCSGLGSLRRKPESRWRKQSSQLRQLEKTQQELLDAGIDSLKFGGVLLYSTCSPVISETNSQVADALARHPEVELVDLKPVLLSISPELTLNQNRKTVQLWTHIHGTDSMFMAAFRKVK